MSACEALHEWANSLSILRFPFDDASIPLNGIYILFERGEVAHGGNRIVRVGTHTGTGQLRSRLRQHFLVENKDRSIFRKNIGRALLNRDHDPFLPTWELDRTSRLAREARVIDLARQSAIEVLVSQHIQKDFTFIVFRVDDKTQRLGLESKIISTVSLCEECQPSTKWLGLYSPKDKIRASGLWLVNELYKEPLSPKDLELLGSSCGCPPLPAEATARARALPPHLASAGPTERVKLHEEIADILRSSSNAEWMTTAEIAAIVNERGRYRKQNGTAVTDFQVHGRTRKYEHLFERQGSRVRLKQNPA
jgi:hypothetical protein